MGNQGRIVLPAKLRERLGIAPGDELALELDGDRLVLEPRAAAARRARGMFGHLATEVSVADELVSERRQEARRERDG